MSNEKTLRTLQRMIERMERTLQYCQNESFASVQSNLMLQEACVFNLLQIGELAHNGLDEAFSRRILSSHGDRFTVCAIVLRMIMRESVCKLSGKPSPKISLC